MLIRTLALATYVCVLAAPPASAQTPAPTTAQAADESLRDIHNLLELTGASKLGTQMAGLITQQILAGVKQAAPGIPARGLEIVQQTLDAEFAKAWDGPDGLTQQIVTVYARHFSHDEIRQLIAFYNTDVGKKMIEVTPVLMQECASAGQQWAMKQMPRIEQVIQDKLKAEGFIK